MRFSTFLTAALGALITLSAGCKDTTQPTPITSPAPPPTSPPPAPPPAAGPTDAYIYVASADGSAITLLARGWRPSWSPDGKQVVYTSIRDGDAEIFVVNADGSADTQITQNTDEDRMPRWSPQGDRIAFVRRRTGGDQLFVMNADGTNVTALAPDATRRYASPSWSPDGRRLAFSYIEFQKQGSSTLAIAVINGDGSGLTRLTNTMWSDYSNDLSPPSWSPDGSRIAFNHADGGTYVVNAGGEDLIKLTSMEGYEHWGFVSSRNAVWSPDGSKIAVARGENWGAWGPGPPPDIWVVNADGTQLTRLTVGGDMPTWLPNGRQILYTSYTSTSDKYTFSEGIAVVPLSAGTPRTLVSQGYSARPSPDGTRIVFEARSPL